MEKQKHCDLILQHMKTYGSIDHKVAEKEYDCARLAARIKDLRNRGVEIETKMVSGKNKHGGKTRYAVYRMGAVEC